MARPKVGCTEPFDGRDNPRVRDLIDLQLARQLLRDADLSRVRDACITIFEARGTHPWPPDLVHPASWPAAYRRLAEENATRVTGDIDGATRSIRELIDKIDDAQH